MTNILPAITRRVAPAIVLALAVTGCSLEKQASPTLSGPSTVALSLSVAASPSSLPRDGNSVSTISVVTAGADGRPIQQRVLLTTTAGTLSSSDVTTNSSGQAVVQFTAPSVNTSATTATITAQPVESSGTRSTSVSKTVTINLSGPGIPVAAFTASTTTPSQFDLVTFDATGTTLNGAACGTACTYVFDFGDGSNSTAQVATHRYSSVGTFVVTLTVTGSGGTSSTKTQSIAVAAAKSITASFTLSPTSATVGDTVRVDAAASTTPDGASISSYAWDFGCGTSGTPTCSAATATGVTASTVYNTARTYTITLTITDSLGRTATTSHTIDVK
jgi:PKD repeat protein